MSSTMVDEAVWRAVRDDFPFVTQCVYLNTAAAGVSWRGQGAAAAAFYDDAKALGFNGMARWREMAATTRVAVAQLTGASAQEVKFVGSTTEGLNLVALSVPWRSGDEVVVADDEFPSVARACDRAQAAGAVVRRVAIPSEHEREEVLAASITPATRMLAVSHVHWATGTRVDVARLAAECDRVGAMLLVDGVQALGATPVNLGSTHVYCASVFKWLLSGFGLAVVIVRDAVQRELSPVVRGYNNPPPSTELQYSHVNYPGICALGATLEYIERMIGFPGVYARVDALTEQLSAELEARGFAVVTPRGARAGIVSCRVENSEGVRDALAVQGIWVESRDGLLRIAPHFYNTHDDIDTAIDALATTHPSRR